MPLNAATQAAQVSVAPMMDWTDRHCRVFHRQICKHALLYTEMLTAPAVIHGDRDRLLRHDPSDHPVALQLGGSDPLELAEACRIASDFAYDEINLNVGCPSDRVQSGAFGAVLMKHPSLVARCVDAMQAATDVPVTVKCRIGVDEQTPEEILPDFLAQIVAVGVERVTIHARMAWLQGLSPKQNRDVPPLNYALVHEMKQIFPNLHISLNGGLATLDDGMAAIENGLDGAMFGRAAYHSPYDILAEVDQRVFGSADRAPSRAEVVARMLPYIEAHLSQGGRLHQVSRHMLGLFAGQPGARGWRRVLSEGATKEGAGPELVVQALAEVQAHAV